MKKIIATCLLTSFSLVAQNKKVKKIATNLEIITIGGECYWCVEAVYENLIRVKTVISGFAGGRTINPSYEEVSSENTGHAEVVQITYDKNIISLDEIFKVFFTVHNPTTLNRQGADVGLQYRSVIFYKKCCSISSSEKYY